MIIYINGKLFYCCKKRNGRLIIKGFCFAVQELYKKNASFERENYKVKIIPRLFQGHTGHMGDQLTIINFDPLTFELFGGNLFRDTTVPASLNSFYLKVECIYCKY